MDDDVLITLYSMWKVQITSILFFLAINW